MSKYTAFRCPEDLLERAKARAQEDRRSLSNYIITLIEKDVGSDPGPTTRSKPAKSTKPEAGAKAAKEKVKPKGGKKKGR